MKKEMLEQLNGISVNGYKVDKLIVLSRPKNNFDSLLHYAICKSGDKFIHLEYREQNKGCGNYAWTSAYPFMIEEDLIPAHALNDCYGGWDNGCGTPEWFDESYKK